MQYSMIRKIFVYTLITAHLAMFACTENPSSPNPDEAPELPPISSMSVDFSLFDNDNAALPKSADAFTKQNFANAAVRVLLANTATVVVLAIPVAVLAKAFTVEPELKEDGYWHWTYTETANGQNWQADLAGTLDLQNQESIWEMRITNSNANPALENFLWYEGRAKFDNSSGVWHIYDPQSPDTQVELLQIDWSHPSEEQATLEFTNKKPDVDANGDKLTYNVDGDLRSVSYFDNSASATTLIEWNASTGEGSITAPDYKGGEKSCWDASQDDVDCGN